MQAEWSGRRFRNTSVFICRGCRTVNIIPVNQSTDRNRWMKHAHVKPGYDTSVSVGKRDFYKLGNFPMSEYANDLVLPNTQYPMLNSITTCNSANTDISDV